MKDKELLLEAINNYEVLTPSHRKVLKVIIDLAIDDVAIINVTQLSKISSCSRPLIYQALDVFIEQELITISKKKKTKINSITLKSNKLKEIIKHYELQIETSKKYIEKIE